MRGPVDGGEQEPQLEPLLSIDALNKQFYDGYPRDYFESALMLCLSGFQDPKQAVAPLEDATIKFGEGEGVLRIEHHPDEGEVQGIALASKLQLVALYHHTFETLTRLFLAHQPVRAEIHDALSRTKAWVRLAAHESLRAEPHHAFKHGISVQAGTPYLGMYGSDSDPRTNAAAQPFIQTTGESLVFLRKDRKSGDWSMEHRGLRLSEMTSSIFLVQKLIRTILQVGETRFVTKTPPVEPLHLAETTPGEVYSAVNLSKGFEIRDFTMPLG